jgi:poly-gamma-glutamate capsule biosynthesis protein CapA/YwtB (metallophosphatase superfamily)
LTIDNLKCPAVIILLLGLLSWRAASQSSDSSHLSLLFAGDIMGHDEQIAGAWDTATKSYNYEPVFRFIKPSIVNSDLAIANLEVTLAGPPYKGYPQFSSPDALAAAAKDAGFDVFIQANNHALDRGPYGFKRTLHVLDSLGILHTGTFADSMDRRLHYPLILEKNNIRIALLNYTYGTNGIEIPRPYIINRIDTARISLDLEKARLASPDFVIVTIHWGEEYERFANAQQKRLASFILSHGADAIIGSHPHVIQPVELFYNTDSVLTGLVVYSLGNFVSNQRAQYKDGGIAFCMDLLKSASGTRIGSFSYLPSWVYREDIQGRSVFYVLPVSLYEKNNNLILLKEFDQYKIGRFAGDTREHLKNVPEWKEGTRDGVTGPPGH